MPIVPLNSKNITKEIIGFLCVDCNVTDVFNETYDPHLLLGTADGIYNNLKRYYNKNKIK